MATRFSAAACLRSSLRGFQSRFKRGAFAHELVGDDFAPQPPENDAVKLAQVDQLSSISASTANLPPVRDFDTASLGLLCRSVNASVLPKNLVSVP